MVAVAIGGAAVIGGATSVISGNKAAKAQKNAANAQVAEAQREYNQNRADLAPWRTVGQGALSQLAGAYGISTGSTPTTGGTASTGGYGGFFTSPGYQFRVDQGNKAVERSAAARGLLGSGATVKAIDQYTQNVASDEYNNWWNRLAGLAGVGQNATNATVAAGQNASNTIVNAIGSAGNARASSYANTGSAINGTINNVMQAYLYGQGFGGGGANAYGIYGSGGGIY